ncbi:MAG: alkaline phosphatase family protein [Candidatus Jettenia sp.]|nr:alkaline phosphatase family protein [Candidatus Jettenia sp.]
MEQKILLLQIAGLGYNFLRNNVNGQKLYDLDIKPMQGVFPGLTCVVQATMRTASLPAQHGIVGNGFFFKDQWKPLFWEQSIRLIQRPLIWENFRSHGGRVAQMFLQQSLGPGSDVFLSPAPIHKHRGGIIMNCISEPSHISVRLEKELKGAFPLHHYWGPFASKRSSRWIVKAIMNVMGNERPDLLYAYLPHLDYALQRSGPDSTVSKKAFVEVYSLIGELLRAAQKEKYRVILFGDYPVTPANTVVFPNIVLKKAGLLKTRFVQGMQYPDFYTSAAFSVVDHQVAHVYVFNQNLIEEVRSLLAKMPHIDTILDGTTKAEAGVDHTRSGELILVAKRGAWFDYRWWTEVKEAPEYAFHVDIHNKPGYDPCELFWGWPPFISQNPSRIKGTHGRVDENEPIFYASDRELPGNPVTLMDLSLSVKSLLDVRVNLEEKLHPLPCE